MKKLSAALVFLFILLILSGCEGSAFAPDFAPQKAFTLLMTAELNGKSFAAALTCDTYESLSLSFTGPPELSGFSVRTEGDGFVIDAGGAEDAVPADGLRADAPLRLLFRAVKAAVFTNHGAFVRDGESGGYTADLTADGFPVTAAFDREGYLLTLTAPGLTASFTRPAGDP